MIRAELVKHLEGFSGDASLYKLSEPISYGYDDLGGTTPYVVVSATVVLGSGPETYIFPADEHGHILNWSELPGSFRGDLDHVQAIENAGWELARNSRELN